MRETRTEGRAVACLSLMALSFLAGATRPLQLLYSDVRKPTVYRAVEHAGLASKVSVGSEL